MAATNNIKFKRFYGLKSQWDASINAGDWKDTIVFGQIKDDNTGEFELKIYAGTVVVNNSSVHYIYDISDAGECSHKVHIDVSTCSPEMYYDGKTPLDGYYYIKEEYIAYINGSTNKPTTAADPSAIINPNVAPRRTAYIFDASLNNGAWVALDGNVDATNVYFKDGVRRKAGIGRLLPNYDGVNEGGGKNLKDLLEYYLWANPCKVNFYNDDGITLLYPNLVDSYVIMEGETPNYGGQKPTKSSDAQYNYEFKGWDPEIGPIDEDTNYVATYDNILRSYTITWKLNNGLTDKRLTLNYGANPSYNASYGANPSKGPDEQWIYEFKGWDPEVSTVIGDATYNASYNLTLRKYTIRWVDYNDQEILTVNDISYGEDPSNYYNLPLPQRSPDEGHTYNFNGWDPAKHNVSGNQTYKAKYTSTIREYTITWNYVDTNGNSSTKSFDVLYGVNPNSPIPINSQYRTEASVFTLKGWKPQVHNVSGNQIYNASYIDTPRMYKIDWYRDNGTYINNTSVAWHNIPLHASIYKDPDISLNYTFVGWTPTPVAVIGDTSYRATYTASPRQYNVTWKNGDVLLYDVSVDYGVTPTYNGVDPSIQDTSEWHYEFNHRWTPEVVPVVGNAIYNASYNAIKQKYTITWENWNGDLLETDYNVSYGETPQYNGNEPLRQDTSEWHYQFNQKWEPAVHNVTGNQTYNASFNVTKQKYTITWNYKDNNGNSSSKTSNINYGDNPGSPISQDQYYQTNTSIYRFGGWNPQIHNVSGNQVYNALYNDEIRYYVIVWNPNNGESVEPLDYLFGERPLYPHDNPVKPATTQYTYDFKGWVPEIGNVSMDKTYNASYYIYTREYDVKWYNYDNTLLYDVSVPYNTTPTYPGALDPSRASDGQYTYTFAGWNPQPSAIVADTSYNATYTATPISNTYKIYTNGTVANDNDDIDWVGWWYTDDYQSGPINNEVPELSENEYIGLGFGPSNIGEYINDKRQVFVPTGVLITCDLQATVNTNRIINGWEPVLSPRIWEKVGTTRIPANSGPLYDIYEELNESPVNWAYKFKFNYA